jgi:hypothetical protein
MKFHGIFIALVASAMSGCSAFTASSSSMQRTTTTPTQKFMFSGAGEGLPTEENSAELAEMEKAAKAFGITVEEYKLGMMGRTRLAKELDSARITGGSKDSVAVERDGNNPPKFIEVILTEKGKALGKTEVSKQLVNAFNSASESSRKVRVDAQKNMMAFLDAESKKLGPK